MRESRIAILSLAVGIAIGVESRPANAVFVNPGETLVIEFEAPVLAPQETFSLVGFELLGGPELQLSAWDSWDVYVAEGNAEPNEFPARIAVDPFGQFGEDTPLEFSFFRVVINAYPAFSGPNGRLILTNSQGGYGIGDVEVFLGNGEFQSFEPVPASVTGVVVTPEPGIPIGIAVGALLLPRRITPIRPRSSRARTDPSR